MLRLQHEHGIRVLLDQLDVLRVQLSVSSRVGGQRGADRRALAAALEALPEVEPRYRRLNAEEPYRLMATCIRQRLLNTARRVADRRAARAGPRLRRRRRRCWPT